MRKMALVLALAVTIPGTAGGWEVNTRESLLDGSKEVYLSQSSDPSGSKMTLMCSDKGTLIAFDAGSNVGNGSTAYLKYSIDGGPVQSVFVVNNGDRVVARMKHTKDTGVITYSELLRSNRLVVGVPVPQGGLREFVFDISGFEDAVVPIRGFCKGI